jgi:hypothetical protein
VPLYSERYQLITAAGTSAIPTANGDLGRSQRPAALPADARHAEPPHHRPASGRSRRAGAADAGVQLDDRAVFAHPHRQMVVDHAAQPGRDASASPSRSAPFRSSSPMPATRSGWSRRRASRTRRWSRRCWTRRWRWRTISAALGRDIETCEKSTEVFTIEIFYQTTTALLIQAGFFWFHKRLSVDDATTGRALHGDAARKYRDRASAPSPVIIEPEGLEGPLLPILHGIQEEFGYVPTRACRSSPRR